MNLSIVSPPLIAIGVVFMFLRNDRLSSIGVWALIIGSLISSKSLKYFDGIRAELQSLEMKER